MSTVISYQDAHCAAAHNAFLLCYHGTRAHGLTAVYKSLFIDTGTDHRSEIIDHRSRIPTGPYYILMTKQTSSHISQIGQVRLGFYLTHESCFKYQKYNSFNALCHQTIQAMRFEVCQVFQSLFCPNVFVGIQVKTIMGFQ